MLRVGHVVMKMDDALRPSRRSRRIHPECHVPGACVGTVEIGTDAAAQVGHIVFGETGIGTGGAVMRAVEAGFDTGAELTKCARRNVPRRDQVKLVPKLIWNN